MVSRCESSYISLADHGRDDADAADKHRGGYISEAELEELLQLPTEELLTRGSDSRTHTIDGTMNRYGCRPYPRAALPFGSCTASSPSPEVYEAAAELHLQLRTAARENAFEEQAGKAYARVTANLRQQLCLEEVPDVEIALTPSGTDAEFLATLLSLGNRQRELVNIVVGPHEVGSGSENAAAGKHFDECTPHGTRCAPGASVCESVAGRVFAQTVHLRDDTGKVREPEELDGEVQDLAQRALAGGRRVLLHIVAHSKTGVHAPRLELARALQRQHPDEVDVIVDAAQGRVSRRGLRESLQAGWLVLFTGSKFYGGPPFSGSLLVPGNWSPERRQALPIPREFSDYFSRWDMPSAWAPFTEQLERKFNLGLLLRWTSAAQALQEYYSVPPKTRFAVLRRFEDYVPTALLESTCLELDSVEPVRFPAGAERLLESKTTVFPFRVRVGGGTPGGFLKKDALRQVAFWLNRDLSHFAPEAPGAVRQSLRPSYHIGQPVYDGDDEHAAVLRFALGAALATSVGVDKRLGHTLEERLEWLERQVSGAFTKLEWIAQNFDGLANSVERGPELGPK